MDIFLKVLLFLHIAGGVLSLTSGALAIAAAKGHKLHKSSGKIFFICMLVVTSSAFIISILKTIPFLLYISVFSFYQNYMGYRAQRNKSLAPSPADWFVLGLAAINTVFMIGSLMPVLMVFGCISLALVIGNLRTNFSLLKKNAPPPQAWLKRHIGMMMGAYIATVTAFIVVNSNLFAALNLPQWLPWLLPSALLAPLSVYFTRKYTSRNKRKATSPKSQAAS